MFKDWMLHRNQMIHYASWITIGLMAVSVPTSKFTFSMFQFFLAGLFILSGINYNECTRFFQKSTGIKKVFFAIPFSIYVSIMAIGHNIRELPNKKVLTVFCLFYMVHLLAVLYSGNLTHALGELRSKLPMLLIPLFFSSIKMGKDKWKSIVLLLFVASVFISTIIGLWHFVVDPQAGIRAVSPLIHHINFSVFIVFSIFIMMVHPFDQLTVAPLFSLGRKLLIIWLFLFLILILKSLTGIVVLLASVVTLFFFPELYKIRMHPLRSRMMAAAIVLGAIAYVGYALVSFYHVEPINFNTLEENTSMGNPYAHDISEPMLENGHLVFIYIADKELKDAWTARSNLDYEGKDKRGHDLRYTLYRYMTSLGLRKDAEGLEALSNEDIQHVENGLTNYIYTRKYSLYPRIYQTIWEYDLYRKTDGFSEKSFIQRLVSVRIGIQVARDNPVFGVGTGDVVDAYHEKYHETYDLVALEVSDKKLITGANQWLNFVVAFGLVGFLVILWAFVYPAKISGAFHNPLFVSFLVISCIAMFGEDMLRFQTGLGFFAFFYSFFVFLKPAANSQIRSSS